MFGIGVSSASAVERPPIAGRPYAGRRWLLLHQDVDSEGEEDYWEVAERDVEFLLSELRQKNGRLTRT